MLPTPAHYETYTTATASTGAYAGHDIVHHAAHMPDADDESLSLDLTGMGMISPEDHSAYAAYHVAPSVSEHGYLPLDTPHHATTTTTAQFDPVF